MRKLAFMIVFLGVLFGFPQHFYAQSIQNKSVEKKVKRYLSEAAKHIETNNFAEAEAAFRKAVSADPENDLARYNFGKLYLENDKHRDAFLRLLEATEKSEDKSLRHKSFHNKGNIFMKDERYPEAVEAYKNALRNNPTDEETRYNLALAKKMMEDEGGDGGDDDDNETQQPEENEGEGEDNEEQNQEEKDQEGEQDSDSSGGDEEQENEEDGDEGENENDEGEQEEQNEQPTEGGSQDENQEGDSQEQTPESMEGKLSPEQIQNLLEAIENKDREAQEKVNEQKERGTKVNSDKDW